ncbi:replicative DNA helicase [Clostridium tetani]|uniref:replicative DNA helicase n=1 Tax=Clostridium tetani TaxID=1513 RepID=UPI00100988CF|nr:replicative DNA helicase [Clostridium tetani]RXI60144.1 replicative DNA helicase [Clostridium tetani]RXI61027.1 replicative DNA helicase [Clostridium tetani]RXI64971.1 replicative DNA helicase [Clostridium tetani]RXI71020.1 replicative DNA helicase [Clostridium tetani]
MLNQPLPNDKIVEITFLSNIFNKNDIMVEAIGTLKPIDFYYKPNEIIFSKMLELYTKNIPLDVITLSNNIDRELLKSIGGVTYLSEVMTYASNTANYKTYIKLIKDLSDKRQIIISCQDALSEALESNTDTKQIINKLENTFININKEEEQESTVNSSELMESTVIAIEEGYKRGGVIPGITTGYIPLDNATNGFNKEDLFVIAARPSMGKTALTLNILNKLPQQYNAMLFELEMSKEKLGMRLLAPKILRNSRDLARGKVNDKDFEVIIRKCSEIAAKNNIFINTKPNLSINEIRAEAKKVKIKYGLDIIFVDHIGKIRPDNTKSSRNDQIGQICNGLKAIAKELNVCVVILSQLNRACEQRYNKRPMLSDLRDSGNIEQDADQIIFLYRDDYYAEREGRESSKPEIMEILIAKNRDGEAGIIELYYNTEYQIITEKSIFNS